MAVDPRSTASGPHTSSTTAGATRLPARTPDRERPADSPKREARRFHGSRATDIPLPPRSPRTIDTAHIPRAHARSAHTRARARTHNFSHAQTRETLIRTTHTHTHTHTHAAHARQLLRVIADSNGKVPPVPSPLLHNPNPSRHDPQSQSLSRSYGSILSTSLTYISLCG